MSFTEQALTWHGTGLGFRQHGHGPWQDVLQLELMIYYFLSLQALLLAKL